jgi:hypothetical protein
VVSFLVAKENAKGFAEFGIIVSRFDDLGVELDGNWETSRVFGDDVCLRIVPSGVRMIAWSARLKCLAIFGTN